MYNSLTMVKNFLQKIDRLQLFSGALVLFGTLLIYVKTMAPTLSFWDCGEFIACSYILGIPHPPGTPLYILIGRIFSITPLFDDISARVNFLSGLSSAFTALFCYLCAAKILAYWFDNKADLSNRLIIHAGSVSGALIAAFGITNWNNSVEAEVYGLSMMLFMAILWLTLIYLDKRDEPGSIKIVALIFYLAFLGIGVHMTTFLVLPIVSLESLDEILVRFPAVRTTVVVEDHNDRLSIGRPEHRDVVDGDLQFSIEDGDLAIGPRARIGVLILGQTDDFRR